jgi:hypothetical protein
VIGAPHEGAVGHAVEVAAAHRFGLCTRCHEVPFQRTNRVGGGVTPPPLTPPDMRARIRRFVKPSV